MASGVQRGQRQSIHTVVDRLVEGGVPRVCVKRQVGVGGAENLEGEGATEFGED